MRRFGASASVTARCTDLVPARRVHRHDFRDGQRVARCHSRAEVESADIEALIGMTLLAGNLLTIASMAT
jgi:hypothetical protein